MRIIIICGDPDCGEEYPADTKDRMWECPHCGRTRENQYYPFLNAQLMNARIHSDEADWKTHHDELLTTARGKAADLRDRVGFLRKDLQKLRVQLPEEDRAGLADLASPEDFPSFLGRWAPEASTSDASRWRELHDRLLEGARGEILSLEDAVKAMETEIKDIKSKLALA
jgi:predicted  nucleic acid-binding Zn-ribbon protein